MISLLLSMLALASARSPLRPFPFKSKHPENCLIKFGPWSSCTIPCGPGGTQQRLGEIVVHAKYGGTPCGPLLQKRPCQDNPGCAPPEVVHCQVWFGEWSECSKHCGGGFQWRRGVIEKEPKNGGKPCPPLEQEQACNLGLCDEPKQDCKVSYNVWSACSTSCGPGFQWRRATVIQAPTGGGTQCPRLEQERACNQDIQCTEPDVDCLVVYGQWGPCSKPCGGGFQWRRGTVTVARQGNGKECPALEQEQSCNNHACTTAPIDCKVQWSEYGDCSLPCGGGTKKRWARVVQRPANGGVPCPLLEQEIECNTHLCLVPVECKLWFPEWSSCSASCGGGVKRRRGLVEIAPQNGGKPCPPIEQTLACNDHECDERVRDCKVSYAAWSECSQPCGGGLQWRRGAIVEPAVGGGKPCPPSHELEQEQSCNTFNCDPILPKNCQVKYSDWGDCSKPCGGGIQQRWGKIIQKNEHGGSPCPELQPQRPCNDHLCDLPVVDCKVQYSSYSQCSASCGGGIKRRRGKIIRQPRNGGAPCPALEQEEPCNTDVNCVPGIVDCIVKYTKWTPCSKLCAGGSRQRWGEIIQHPSQGGAPCKPLEESESCNVDPCAPLF